MKVSRVLITVSCLILGVGCSNDEPTPTEALQSYPAIAAFVSLAEDTELLTAQETLTIFAPVDEAIKLETVEDPSTFVNGLISSESLSSSALLGRVGSDLVMKSGRVLTVGREGSYITLTNEAGEVAKLIAVDVDIDGKIVHFLDSAITE